MANVVEKQSDGLYAIWNSVISDYVMIDATKEELLEFYSEKALERVKYELDHYLSRKLEDANEERIKELRKQWYE